MVLFIQTTILQDIIVKWIFLMWTTGCFEIRLQLRESYCLSISMIITDDFLIYWWK